MKNNLFLANLYNKEPRFDFLAYFFHAIFSLLTDRLTLRLCDTSLKKGNRDRNTKSFLLKVKFGKPILNKATMIH